MDGSIDPDCTPIFVNENTMGSDFDSIFRTAKSVELCRISIRVQWKELLRGSVDFVFSHLHLECDIVVHYFAGS